MTAATFAAHWAFLFPNGCCAIKSGHSAELSQGQPRSVATYRSKVTITSYELTMPTHRCSLSFFCHWLLP